MGYSEQLVVARFVSRYWWGSRSLIFPAASLMLLATSLNLAVPYLAKEILEQRDDSALQSACLVGVLLVVFYHVTSLGAHLIAYRAAQDVTFRMMRDGVEMLCAVPWHDLACYNPTEYAQLIVRAARVSGDAIAAVLTDLLSSFFGVVGIAFVIVFISPTLSLMFACVVGLTQGLSFWYKKYFPVSGLEFGQADARVQALVVSVVQRSVLTRIFRCSGYVLRVFDARAELAVASARRLNFGIHSHAAVATAATNVCFILLVGVTSLMRARGVLDFVDVALFFFYMRQLLDRVQSLINEFNKLLVLMEQADPFQRLICSRRSDESPSFQVGQTAVSSSSPLVTPVGAVVAEFQQVTYRYPAGDGSDSGISSVSFLIRAGSLTAMIGASGAGKSTCLRLLARVLQPQSGSVNTPCTVAMLEQSASVLPGTVMDNILLGNPAATYEQLILASKRSGCFSFVSILPQGFDTFIENTDSAQFSGGQLQRICLARVFLSSASLVLFDEPTTGLDDVSVDMFAQAAVQLKDEGRAVVFASHEKRIVTLADQVISI